MIGLGAQEIIVLAILGGGAAIAVGVILYIVRGSGRTKDLEAENRRLREELDRRKE